MKSLNLISHFYIPTHSNLISPKPNSPSFLIQKHIPISQIMTKTPPITKASNRPMLFNFEELEVNITPCSNKSVSTGDENSRIMIVGAVSLGLMMLLMGSDDHQQALAFGPEGPLMEDFWDNMRRYGLYALTVSSGVLYAVFQPLYELLKNPISAILVITILGGGFYIVSQVVYAMVGITDFSYDLNY